MKITKNLLKELIKEQLEEQSSEDMLSGPTRTGPNNAVDPNNPLSGATRAGPQNQQVQQQAAQQKPQQQQAAQQKPQQQQGAVSKQAVLNIKKQLTVLSQQIDKLLGVR